MLLRRCLAMLLLLILPLQATLAAVDGCCMPGRADTTQLASVTGAPEQATAAQDDASGDCCVSCDFCQHAGTACVPATHPAPLLMQAAAPPIRPEPPFHSFIPDLVPRPDLAV